MEITRIAVIGILTAVLCKLFSKDNKEYALFLKIAATIMILISVIWYTVPIAETVRGIFGRTGADTDYLNILFKALGICYITQFAYDICKDSGENALATQIETAGKVTLILISLPLFETLMSIVSSLL